MFEPAAGGPLGATGLSWLNSLLHPVTDTARTSKAIRKIGEGRLTRKKLRPGQRTNPVTVIRMTRIHVEPHLNPSVRLRTLTTTVRAMATGITNAALRRIAPADVELRIGDRAPEFRLPASDGFTYTLSDYYGRAVVIAWFPKAFTGGCTAECRSLGASDEALRRFNAKQFAASVDSPGTNAEFAAGLGLPYPILCDETKETARAYGVLGASGFPSRWTFYIGPDGRILDIDKRVHASTHGHDVAARLAELGIS
jgi:peroxiredoxin Q/BCP